MQREGCGCSGGNASHPINYKGNARWSQWTPCLKSRHVSCVGRNLSPATTPEEAVRVCWFRAGEEQGQGSSASAGCFGDRGRRDVQAFPGAPLQGVPPPPAIFGRPLRGTPVGALYSISYFFRIFFVFFFVFFVFFSYFFRIFPVGGGRGSEAGFGGTPWRGVPAWVGASRLSGEESRHRAWPRSGSDGGGLGWGWAVPCHREERLVFPTEGVVGVSL